MENVDDLLQLSHEYQVKQLIFDPCVKFLEDQSKTTENVMKILSLAQLYNLEKLSKGCVDLLRNMRLESLSETVHLQDLDKEQTQYYLTQRIERLEKFLDEVYPQFFGVVKSLMSLAIAKHKMKRCSTHVGYDKFSQPVSYLQIRDCPDCRSMLSEMVQKTRSINTFSLSGAQGQEHQDNFDANLFSVMADFSKLKNS